MVRLRIGTDGHLEPTDFFSPANNAKLNRNDADLGSGAPLAIPDGYGTAGAPTPAGPIGKDGTMYLLDRDNLGGMAQGPGGTDAVLDKAGPYNGVWGKPAFLGTSTGGYIYVVESNGYLRAFKLVHEHCGRGQSRRRRDLRRHVRIHSGTPVVSPPVRTGHSALVWVVYVSGGSGPVRNFAPTVQSRTTPETSRRCLAPHLGTGAKFSSVATDKGRVYVGTGTDTSWASAPRQHQR